VSAGTIALAVYSVQVLAVVGVATLAVMAVRLTLPAARLQYWRGVLALCLVLPVLPDFSAGGPVATVTLELAAATPTRGEVPEPWAPALLTSLPWLIAAGAAARLLWLAAGAWRLGRLRRCSEAARLDPVLEALRQSLAPHADVRLTDELTQPVTFGWRRPVVLLPPRFDALSGEAQRGVLCHELLHVRRRDWLAIAGEELLRAVLWFHPAVWWALEQIHLSREQVVDRLVVERTGSRRAYMDALVYFADAPDTARPAIAFLRRRHLAFRLRQISKEPHMTRLRLVCAAAALLLVLTGATAGVLSALPLELPALGAQAGATSLEVRLAELQPGPGLREAVVEGSNQRIYMHAEAIVTAADVTIASVVDAAGRYSVDVGFTPAAATRLVEATTAHAGRPMAILIDGKVIAAPVVRSAIGGRAVINGGFTQAQAERIASGLRPSPGAGAAAPQHYKGSDPGVVLPRVVTEVKPQYTPEAMQAKIQGWVEMQIVVRADGSVGDIIVTKSLDTTYGLDAAAVAAARQWTFDPGTKDGSVVDVEVTLNFKFTLA